MILKAKGQPIRSKTAAVREAERLHREGKGCLTSDPVAIEYAAAAWVPGSEYLKGRERRGVKLSADYVYINEKLLKKHFEPYLKGLRISALTSGKVEKVMDKLADAGVSLRSINYGLQAFTVPIRDYCRKNQIPYPLEYVRKLDPALRERGVLSLDEMAKLQALADVPVRARAAFLLGALCGLRLGECRGLQWSDIDEAAGIINVQHNVVNEKADGLKGCKWGSARITMLSEPVKEALQILRDTTPAGADGYVLWNEKRPGKPCPAQSIQLGFRTMLHRIGIDEKSRQARNLSFHGLRHLFVTLSRIAGIPDFTVQSMTGHKSSAMMDKYSHGAKVIDFTAARDAMAEALKAAGGGA